MGATLGKTPPPPPPPTLWEQALAMYDDPAYVYLGGLVIFTIVSDVSERAIHASRHYFHSHYRYFLF